MSIKTVTPVTKMTVAALKKQLYKPSEVWGDYEAALELRRRNQVALLEKATTSNRLMTTKAAKYALRQKLVTK